MTDITPASIPATLRLALEHYISVHATDVFDPPPGLNGYLAHADQTFSERLFTLIRASGELETTIYKRAHIDRKHFSKIRSDKTYIPKKQTVISFAVALRLSPTETDALLASAGYALSHGFTADLIVRYFIERGVYDLYTINDALFSFNQALLNV